VCMCVCGVVCVWCVYMCVCGVCVYMSVCGVCVCVCATECAGAGSGCLVM